MQLGDVELVVFSARSQLGRLDSELPAGLRDVLQLIAAGSSNAQIARKRGVSPRTVANQVATLLRLYSADSRADLVRKVEAGEVPSRHSQWGPRCA